MSSERGSQSPTTCEDSSTQSPHETNPGFDTSERTQRKNHGRKSPRWQSTRDFRESMRSSRFESPGFDDLPCSTFGTMCQTSKPLEAHRTVCITNIPLHFSIHDILQQLDFGVITEVKPSIIRAGSSSDLLVTFLTSAAANDCITTTLARVQTVHSLQGFATTFSVVPSALSSLPVLPELSSLLTAGLMSRALLLTGVSTHLSHQAIASALSVTGSRWHDILAIETVRTTSTGMTLKVHCNSVKNAVRCYRKASTLAFLRQCGVEFAPDASLRCTLRTSDEERERLAHWLSKDDDELYRRRDAIRTEEQVGGSVVSTTARMRNTRAEQGDFAPAVTDGVPRGPKGVYESVHAWRDYSRGYRRGAPGWDTPGTGRYSTQESALNNGEEAQPLPRDERSRYSPEREVGRAEVESAPSESDGQGPGMSLQRFLKKWVREDGGVNAPEQVRGGYVGTRVGNGDEPGFERRGNGIGEDGRALDTLLVEGLDEVHLESEHADGNASTNELSDGGLMEVENLMDAE